MRLLYLCHRLPYPPDKGDKVRSYHQVVGLSRHHEVDVFTWIDDPADRGRAAEFASRVRRLEAAVTGRPAMRTRALLGFLGGRALSVAAFGGRGLLSRLESALESGDYDAVLAFSSNVTPPVLSWRGPRLFDFVDVDSAKWRDYASSRRGPLRWLLQREARLVRELERRACEAADATVVCAEREREELLRFARPRRLECVPNGTDSDYFRPGPSPLPPLDVVFTGAMDYAANVDAVSWFAREVWPRIRARRPQARFAVVGSNPAPAVRRLAAPPEVVVTGRVADVRPYLRAARVAVAPLRVARGIQNKVLEALSCAVPVVGTPQALDGVGRPPGSVAAEGAGAFAAAVLALLDDPALRERLGREGRRSVRERFDWEVHVARLESLLAEILEAGRERFGATLGEGR